MLFFVSVVKQKSIRISYHCTIFAFLYAVKLGVSVNVK